MRDRKKIITLDTDSALVLMQEIYNDIVEQKNIASQITRKMLTFMKDAEDMSVIGSVIDKQQKVLSDCMEKKVSLVKLQSALIKQSGNTGKGGTASFGKLELSSEDRKLLQDMIDEKEDNNPAEDNNEKYSTE